MAVSEQDRHELHGSLEQVLGPGPAATLMAHLPPVGWADVATKRDLDVLAERLEAKLIGVEHRMEARMGGLEHRMGGVEHRMEGLEERMEGLEERMEARMEAGEHRIMATLHRELNHQMRTMVLALSATSSVTLAAVGIAIVGG
jgi:hypothetical protein